MIDRFDSIEEEVIYEKLGGKSNELKSETNLEVKMARAKRYMIEAKKTKDNSAFRPIISCRAYFGKILIFIKRVIRKLIKFYVEPICIQQTKFNNATVVIQDEVLDILNKVIKKHEEYDSFFKNSSFSFSKSGEDCICASILKKIGCEFKSCSYLDLAVKYAKDMNNTFFFYEKGARGVLVVSNSDLLPELLDYREEDQIINEIEVGTISVEDIIKKYFQKTPTIININYEKENVAILNSMNFEKHRPAIIICGIINNQSKNEIIEIMEQNDYAEYAFTGNCSVFVEKREIYRRLI